MPDDGYEAFLSSMDCYAILEGVFLHCRRIRTLSLRGFDFGIDPDIISPTINEGFSRLAKLGMDYCIGDIPMFINQTPIPNLQTIKCCSGLLPDFEYAIVNAISSNYRTLVNFDLSGLYTSSSNILKIVECCPVVERLIIDFKSKLQHSYIKALASLPRLKHLSVNGSIACDAISSLSLLKGLKNLKICWDDDVADVLPVIGQNLISLALWNATAEAWMGIHTHCPNLQYLRLIDHEIDDGAIIASLNRGLKKRLKRLASIKVDDEFYRLGTDWVGYSEFEE
jgi:hypothetical protein